MSQWPKLAARVRGLLARSRRITNAFVNRVILEPPGTESPVLLDVDLAAYKRRQSGTCWWCGATANSREHKFKRSDLARMRSPEGLIWGDTAGKSRAVRSDKRSSLVKFDANLCSTCNNARSQPFNRAYEEFSDYAWNNSRALVTREALDWSMIYGDDWASKSRDLARYFTKHIGCRMAHDGFHVPDGITSVLGGAEAADELMLQLGIDAAIRDHFEPCNQESAWICSSGRPLEACSLRGHASSPTSPASRLGTWLCNTPGSWEATAPPSTVRVMYR